MATVGKRKIVLHGLAVEIDCAVPYLAREIARTFGPFSVGDGPERFSPSSGSVRPFDLNELARQVPANAERVLVSDDLIELYQDGEHFWLVDERWGMAELNLLKNRWRSWIFPHPAIDSVRCTEMAVMWPLAQLLQPRGLHLLPAISIEKEGWSALIFCPFPSEPEIATLMRAGYRIIGQRWTAVRVENQRIELLRLPGRMETSLSSGVAGGWIDITDGDRRCDVSHGLCAAVVVVDPGRRSTAGARALNGDAATALLRHAWPIADVRAARARNSPLPARLASQAQCMQVQLSRKPEEFLLLINAMRARWKISSARISAAGKGAGISPETTVFSPAVRAWLRDRPEALAG